MDGLSFDKYIDNPSGGQAFTNRNLYKQMYKTKFDAVLVREQGQIKYNVFKTEDANDTYYIYIRVPSEVIDHFYYDVVIQLSTTVNEKKNNVNLREYMVRFYANDPAFVYTFAHAFKDHDLFIPDLAQKMSKIALREQPTVKNPTNNVWYVKSLFFAYLAMEKYQLFNRVMLNRHARKYRKSDLLSLITSADIKVKARQDAQEELNKKKKQEKERLRREKEKARNSHIKSKASSITKTSKATNTTKITRTTKTTNKLSKSK